MSFVALTKAHFRLSGGWRQNLLIIGTYVALVVALASAAYCATNPDEYRVVHGTFLILVSVVQGGLVLLVAPSAIRRAVFRDFQSGMIESHRLTPLSGLSLVTGYLTGPTAQAFLLYAVGLPIGGYFAGAYGQSLGIGAVSVVDWYLSQLCLLTLAIMELALVLLVSLATAGRANLMALLVFFGVFVGWGLVRLVPGLALLAGLWSAGRLLMNLLWVPYAGARPGNPAAMGWAMLLQLAIATTLLVAACRKVRAPDRPAFTVRLGLVLLMLAGLTLAAGLYFADSFQQRPTPVEPYWEWVASATVFVLVGLLPLSAAAAERQRQDRRLAWSFSTPPRLCRFDALPLLLTVLSGALMFAMVPRRLELPSAQLSRVGWPVLAVGLSFWTDYCVIYLARSRGRSTFLALVLSWLVLKALPLAIEMGMILIAVLTDSSRVSAGWMAGLSPVGTMVLTVVGSDSQSDSRWVLIGGLAVQSVLAGLATLLVHRARDRLLSRLGPARPVAIP